MRVFAVIPIKLLTLHELIVAVFFLSPYIVAIFRDMSTTVIRCLNKDTNAQHIHEKKTSRYNLLALPNTTTASAHSTARVKKEATHKMEKKNEMLAIKTCSFIHIENTSKCTFYNLILTSLFFHVYM